MNHVHYLSELKKALRGIDRQTRDDILREIKGHLAEMDPDASAEARFGTPEQLAEQYLQDETVSPPISNKVVSTGKKLLVWLSVMVTLIAIGLLAAGWYFSRDKFDYADENAAELSPTQAGWHSTNWQSEPAIDIKQAHVVVYWHEHPTLRWNCSRSQQFTEGEVIRVEQNQCLFFLPKQFSQLRATQANVVLVRPNASLEATTMQSKLRLAIKDKLVQIDIDSQRSAVDNFSAESAAPVSLKINANESTIQRY